MAGSRQPGRWFALSNDAENDAHARAGTDRDRAAQDLTAAHRRPAGGHAINPAVSRAGLGRCLRRHGVSSLLELAARETDKPVTKKSFKDYEPGFLPMDIKYLPQMPDETERRYLFVAIDRATR